MILVCNTGPIIALAKINHLDLLSGLFETIQIPETVFYELMGKPGEETDRIFQATRRFLMVSPMPNVMPPHVDYTTRHLDAGERSVICLANAHSPEVMVMLDDAAGREAARRLGITVTGFVGLLLMAKRLARISRVLPLLEQARASGFWLSDELIQTAAMLAGEE